MKHRLLILSAALLLPLATPPACSTVSPQTGTVLVTATAAGFAAKYVDKGKTESEKSRRRQHLLAAAAALRAANGEGVDPATLRAALLKIDDSPEWAALREALILLVPVTGSGASRYPYVSSLAAALEAAGTSQ